MLRRFLLALFCFVSGLDAQTQNAAFAPERALIGHWKGTDSSDDTASMIFNADGTFRMLHKNRAYDGPTLGGRIIWRLFPDRQPMNLDIIATPPLDKETVLPLTIRFVTPNRIELAIRGNRQTWPIEFSPKKPHEKVILVKQ